MTETKQQRQERLEADRARRAEVRKDIAIPGWEGSIGPGPGQYRLPHVYARDITSGAGNCVCGAALTDSRHVMAAPGVPLPDTTRDYDRDPEALAWARAKVQKDIDRFRRFETQARDRGSEELAAQWRKFANFLQMDFIGGEGCSIAAFDERRPSLPPVDDGEVPRPS